MIEFLELVTSDGGGERFEFPPEWGLIPVENIALSIALLGELPPPHPRPPLWTREASELVNKFSAAAYVDQLEANQLPFEALILGEQFGPKANHEKQMYGLEELVESTTRLHTEIKNVGSHLYDYELALLEKIRSACRAASSQNSLLQRGRAYRKVSEVIPVLAGTRGLLGFDEFCEYSIKEGGSLVHLTLSSGWRYEIPAGFLAELIGVTDSSQASVLELQCDTSQAIEVRLAGAGLDSQYFWTSDIHYLCEPASDEYLHVDESLKTIATRWYDKCSGFRKWPA